MKHLFRAVFIITIFNTLDRVLGFVFKIYLSRELGAASLGVYQVSLSIFFLLLTVTTSGLPLIVSKLTAKYRALNQQKKEHAVTSAALIVGLVSALLVCAVVFIAKVPISKMFASSESMVVLVFLLPGVIFSGIYAAFRGNLWGKEKYAAVSVIEVLEQIVRILLCVILFMLGIDKLKVTAISMSVACGFTAIACAICYYKYKGKLSSPKGQLLPLIKSSAPITLVRASSSIVNSSIAIVVPFLLTMQGLTNVEAMAIFGSSIGMALPLLYLPITVVGALAYVMIPTLSTAYAEKNTANMRKQIESALTFSIIIAALFVPVFWVLGTPIGNFVYDNAASGKFLSQCAWLLIPLSVESIASSMLNSLDLEKQGFFNYLIGSVALFGILFAFMHNFNISILAIGLGVSWTISSILDIWCIKKRTGISLSFVKPLLISAALVFPAAFLTKTVFMLTQSLPILLSLGLSALVGFLFITILGILFGVIDISYIFSKKTRKRTPNGLLS